MKLSAPKQGTWLVALVLGVIGILMQVGALRFPGLVIAPVWFLIAGFLLLVFATAVKDL